MNKFMKELEIGEIHLRDRWQFELKSEFFPLPTPEKNIYLQEFYFFIPNSLQVNQETYSKSQFYQDQTNLIRYKTPEFQLNELYDRTNAKSPLTRLSQLQKSLQENSSIPIIEDELKLLGNSIRSSLRESIRLLIKKGGKVKSLEEEEELFHEVSLFCEDILHLRREYLEVQTAFLAALTSGNIKHYLLYLDEFMSNCINYYLTGFIEYLRKQLQASNQEKFDDVLFHVLQHEHRHREENLPKLRITKEDSVNNEYVLYRSGLLNKFVQNALLLNTAKSSVAQRYRNIIGSISAGIAMLFFFVLFIWQGEVFLINSIPFILITVFLYIIKDRMKEGLKTISYRQFLKWFSDYVTEIRSPDGEAILGKMTESSAFVPERKLSDEITRVRNREFHVVLETFKRQEQVIYYKKKIAMFKPENPVDVRRCALNIIFRFNISQFVKKADNPSQSYVIADPKTKEMIRSRLPKVYHLNIIIKNTYNTEDAKTKVELKKFRVILDKNGIKRIEHVPQTAIPFS
ncbi:MAG: hypothetical protein WB791_05170 [Waddliaceae bacterium]